MQVYSKWRQRNACNSISHLREVAKNTGSLDTVQKMFHLSSLKGFPGGSVVKNLPAMQEVQVQSLGQEGMATHSSILAWRIHGQSSPAGYIVHRVTQSQTQLKGLSMHVSQVLSGAWALHF